MLRDKPGGLIETMRLGRGRSRLSRSPNSCIGSVDPYALKIHALTGGILTNGERSLSISR